MSVHDLPRRPFGTLIGCTVCGATVDVIEIPIGECRWRVDPAKFRCEECKTPVQLELDDDPEPVVFPPMERLSYDPATVEMEL